MLTVVNPHFPDATPYRTNIYAKAGAKISIAIQCFCNDQLKSESPGKKNSKPNKIPKA